MFPQGKEEYLRQAREAGPRVEHPHLEPGQPHTASGGDDFDEGEADENTQPIAIGSKAAYFLEPGDEGIVFLSRGVDNRLKVPTLDNGSVPGLV